MGLSADVSGSVEERDDTSATGSKTSRQIPQRSRQGQLARVEISLRLTLLQLELRKLFDVWTARVVDIKTRERDVVLQRATILKQCVRLTVSLASPGEVG